ncbi:MAG: secretin and TonB N-terminal domain-containing protein [Synergistetes bacterium]|nr:secretin and TonB N-terminal domain-containing protein [Synergistota bacterium]MCX8128249.1 secretin and TonB N-terminal domain-containing protein [Synergistota bacterium]MDW8192696.1 secretin and TonB N-terminal domain-containing protein [Synergistota bacterium]
MKLFKVMSSVGMALFLLFIFSREAIAATKRIEKVEVYPTVEWVKLVIYLSHPAKPDIIWLPGDRERMVISFESFNYRATLRKLPLRRSDVWEVRGGQYTKREARIVVEFSSTRLPYRASESENGKVLVYYFYPSTPRERITSIDAKIFSIEDVKASIMENGLKIVVKGEAPLNPRINWIKGDRGEDRMILDFQGFVFRDASFSQTLNAFGVSGFSLEQFTPHIARLIVSLEAEKVNYKLENFFSGRELVINFFPKAKEEVVPKERKTESYSTEGWASRKVSLEFRDADIRDIFRALAKAVEINIILDQEVSGKITVSFKDIPFAQAFDWVLKISGLSYRNLGNTLIVAKEERLRELFDKKDTKVFLLSNAIASDIAKTVSSITGVENIVIDSRMNALIVQGSQADIKKVEDTIKLLDREVPQVMVEAKLVGVSLESGKSLGVVLSNISKGKFYNISVDPSSQITISYSSDMAASAAFDATINAWISSGKAKVLASPSVATLSGLKAVINLTRDYKYYSRVEEIQNGERTITQKWETITYGPQLIITPYIGEDDKITLDIDIDVSIITRWVEYAGQRIPEIGHRKVTTKLRVKDGQPIIIGGLITEEDIKNLFKVPLLGDIPFIGMFFRSETHSRTREEVVLIVTPRILKD